MASRSYSSPTDDDVVIRAATTADAEAVARIYNHYVTDTIVTFEEEPVLAPEMVTRISEAQAASLPWLIAERNGEIVGYAHASKWKGRCAYRFSAEVTVYVDPVHPRRGFGSQLYVALLPMLEGLGVHAAMGGIALPNEASVALHEKFGFRKVAHFEQVGFKFGQWIDVGYWERIL